ncbi:MAG: pilin [Gammaproteobacteria bacterium]|nr:pilin [Gammaproteobacteria bacterium]MCP4088623.1 pilin [Gammaproteobacteria bacterium]MCP4276469.1 pilin [Gammaproteobacteria bacterium]MCP4832346.1 pilin [Gammaproteobacteria bacterium]MCP4929140.1 pilin [Gammaproteobacteria bacterium]
MTRNHQQYKGFTLIELMTVVVIIGVLATVTISAYQTYSIRNQITEGINLSANAKTQILNYFLSNKEAPADRSKTGLTPNATDTFSNFVTGIEIENGRIDITFGNKANAIISNTVLSLTPYEASNSLIWRCGHQEAPQSPSGGNLEPLGTLGGGNTATYAASTVASRYVPAFCR